MTQKETIFFLHTIQMCRAGVGSSPPMSLVYFYGDTPTVTRHPTLTLLSGSCKQEYVEYENGEQSEPHLEDNDEAVTWQIGFITQQPTRVTQTSQSHVCVTLAVTWRLVALQADNKCVSSHQCWELGDSLSEFGLHQVLCPPGLITWATDTRIPSPITFKADVDRDLKDCRMRI